MAIDKTRGVPDLRTSAVYREIRELRTGTDLYILSYAAVIDFCDDKAIPTSVTVPEDCTDAFGGGQETQRRVSIWESPRSNWVFVTSLTPPGRVLIMLVVWQLHLVR